MDTEQKGTDRQWLITDESADITGITITPNEGSPNNGGTLQLGTSATYSSTVAPDNAIQKVTWSVTPSAGVTLVATDTTATITVNDVNLNNQIVTLTATAADGNATESITVKIALPEIQNINITPTNPTVHVGDTITLNTEIKDQNNNTLQVQPTWTSSDSNIATIDNQGVVTGMQEGTATVAARINNKEASVEVTVTDGIVFYATVPEHWATAYIYAWKGGEDLTQKLVPMERQGAGKYTYHLYNTLNGTTYDSFSIIIASTNTWTNQSKDSEVKLTQGIYEYELTYTGGGLTEAVQCKPKSASLSRRSPAHYSQAEDTWAHIDTSSFTSEQILQDLNPSVGKFKVDLPDGDGTYTLQENKAPDRYFINTQIYTITVENGTITWDPEPTTNDGLHWITDTPNAFSWNKVDAGYLGDDTNGNNPLAGSQWTLQKFTDGAYKNNVNIEDCVSDSQEGCTNKQDTDSRGGFFNIVNLSAGRYRLVEKQAPTGFTTDTSTYYYFEITRTDTASPQWVAATVEYDSVTGIPNSISSNGGGLQIQLAINVRMELSIGLKSVLILLILIHLPAQNGSWNIKMNKVVNGKPYMKQL